MCRKGLRRHNSALCDVARFGADAVGADSDTSRTAWGDEGGFGPACGDTTGSGAGITLCVGIHDGLRRGPERPEGVQQEA